MHDGEEGKEGKDWKGSLRLLAGLRLACRGQESEETWENRRGGRDVVRERGGREGARGIRNEI